jgi:subtilisin family serine protease
MTNDMAGSNELETTGRYIVTYRDGAQTEALAALKKHAGMAKSKLVSTADFGVAGVDLSQISEGGGAILENLGIAIVNIDPNAAGVLGNDVGGDSSILAVEPEGVMYALSDVPPPSSDYFRGFRDAADALYNAVRQGGTDSDSLDSELMAAFSDTATLTWGLQVTKTAISQFSGAGIKVAVLDTGLDLLHPDFAGRPIVSRSFIPGVATAQDGHGHGTHCTGTACGRLQPPVGRRYGVAHKSLIHIGKVLSDAGSGNDGGILAGIDWAVANKCAVISMSLGANIQMTSIAYETAGQRALDAGSLIVAAAGNNASRSSNNFGFVGRPANSRSMLAVAALDQNLRVANFSARDTVRNAGTAVDIAGPGVGVYSTWPMPTRYNSISGTSMATPHVAGVAALWAQSTGARGAALWQRVTTNARTIPRPVVDVGRGLVQAP